MRKDKHSTKKVKPGRSGPPKDGRQTVNKPSPLEDLLTNFYNRRAIQSHPLLYPFSAYAGKPNPFPDVERAEHFRDLIEKIYTMALNCSNPILEFGTKKERRELARQLKKDFRLIPRIFKSLLPRNLKGSRLLRYYKRDPKELVSAIEWLKQKYRQFLNQRLGRSSKLSYRGETMQKGKDIVRFWQELFKEPYPERIYMDDRTETTIALSILAYRAHVSYDRLYKIHTEAKKKAKEHERIRQLFSF
jgi:Txe/YoeB family toxin of Txe-Axe toxin-antitoxin module